MPEGAVVRSGQGAVALSDVTIDFPLSNRRVYTAVAGASLHVADGEFVAIVGPTGCGKSTLLNVAAGLQVPSAGNVRIFGAPLSGLNRQSGYLFQAEALFPWKTALENVAIGPETSGTPRHEARTRAEQWLTRVGLAGFAGRYPRMCRRPTQTHRPRAVLIRDPVPLMDEPFGPLDARPARSPGNLLLDLWVRSQGVLFVTPTLAGDRARRSRRHHVGRPGGASSATGRSTSRAARISEVKLDKVFHDLHREIWHVLKAEVLKGYAQAEAGA